MHVPTKVKIVSHVKNCLAMVYNLSPCFFSGVMAAFGHSAVEGTEMKQPAMSISLAFRISSAMFTGDGNSKIPC